MNKFVKIMLIILLYILLFASAFGLITYFNQLEILQPVSLQLYLGIGCLVSGVIDICVLMGFEPKKERKRTVKEKDKKIKQLDLNLDNKIVDEETLSAQKKEINSADNQEFNETQELYLSTAKLAQLQNKALTHQNGEATVEEKMHEDAIVKNNAEEPKSEIDFSVTSENPQIVKQMVNADLTNTQILYINQSENSYINEQGQPQLMITEEFSAVKMKEEIEKKLAEKQEKEREDEENRLLDSEEKTEKLQNTLEKLIVVFILLIIIVGIYFVLSTFVG